MTARERILAALVDLEKEINVASKEAGCEIPMLFAAFLPRHDPQFSTEEKRARDGVEMICDPIFLLHGIRHDGLDDALYNIALFRDTLESQLKNPRK